MKFYMERLLARIGAFFSELTPTDIMVAAAGLLVILALLSPAWADAKGRPMQCRAAAQLAEAMAKDFGGEFRPEHYIGEWQQRVGEWTRRCKDDPRGISQCVRITCEEEPS